MNLRQFLLLLQYTRHQICITRREFHQVDDGLFEVNEIVLWAAFWADSWQIVSVLRAGRGRGWGMGMVCGPGCLETVLGQERERAAAARADA